MNGAPREEMQQLWTCTTLRVWRALTRLFFIFQPHMDYEHVDLREEEPGEHGNSGSGSKLSSKGLEAPLVWEIQNKIEERNS